MKKIMDSEGNREMIKSQVLADGEKTVVPVRKKSSGKRIAALGICAAILLICIVAVSGLTAGETESPDVPPVTPPDSTLPDVTQPDNTQPPVSLGDEFIEAAGQLVGFADGHSMEIIIDGETQVFQVYDEELVLALQELEGAGGGDFTFRYVQMDSGAMEIKEIIR
ncbi:MAG: hypothetical protein PUK54_03845 [Firmicutes bacterium]|nr:hypothetical protein [Bacillota bacterium]MDY5855551.1 hypothetical protein [Anaerovoracaceae bacterium]